MTDRRYVTVCVQNAACVGRLTEQGRELADRTGCALRVLLLMGAGQQCADSAALTDRVFRCAVMMDAEMNACYTDKPMERLRNDRSECLVMSGGEALAGLIRREMPGRRLVVLE